MLADTVRARLACGAISVTRGRQGVLTCGADGVRWEMPGVLARRRRPHGSGRCLPLRHVSVRRSRDADGHGGRARQRRRRPGRSDRRKSVGGRARPRPQLVTTSCCSDRAHGRPRCGADGARRASPSPSRRGTAPTSWDVRSRARSPRPSRTSRSSSWTTARPMPRREVLGPRRRPAAPLRPARAERRDQPGAEHRHRAGARRVAGLSRRRQRVGRRTISRASWPSPPLAPAPTWSTAARGATMRGRAADGLRADGGLERARLRSVVRGWMPLMSCALAPTSVLIADVGGLDEELGPSRTGISGCGSLSVPTSPAPRCARRTPRACRAHSSRATARSSRPGCRRARREMADGDPRLVRGARLSAVADLSRDPLGVRGDPRGRRPGPPPAWMPEPRAHGAVSALVAARDGAGAGGAGPGPPRMRLAQTRGNDALDAHRRQPSARPFRGAAARRLASPRGAPRQGPAVSGGPARAAQSGARSVRGPPAGTRPAASRSANASGSSGHFGRGIRVNGTLEKTSGGAT